MEGFGEARVQGGGLGGDKGIQSPPQGTSLSSSVVAIFSPWGVKPLVGGQRLWGTAGSRPALYCRRARE